MNATTIICPHCKKPFEISDAIQHLIVAELQKAKEEQTENLRKEYFSRSEEQQKQAVETALAKAKLEAERLLQMEKHTKELELDRLRAESDSSKNNERELRKQLADSFEKLLEAKRAREEAELKAKKELLEKENSIREEAALRASEDLRMQLLEKDKTISRLSDQLAVAKRVADQGSQQLQGEVLELDIERLLKESFPSDSIKEVKKGERGSDIRQTVNERIYQNCGLVLWECKNAKTYQASWLEKLKNEIVAEKAQMGVIVFRSPDNDGADFKQLADNVWLVKPRYAIMLATFLREVLIKVFIANRNAEGKDVKVELIYNYLTSGEFTNRIRCIIESYDEMSRQLDSEKKQAQKRWAAQEKIIQKATNSLYGISGDLQGIAGREIIALPEPEDDENYFSVVSEKD